MPDKMLNVPYLVQPTPITCQSTCLKMYASYLASRLAMSVEGAEASISDIWKTINTGDERPVKGRNSYRNMSWWLKNNFPMYKFSVENTKDVDSAIEFIAMRIGEGFPVMVSTNHSRTAGHIILVIGYKSFSVGQCSDTTFICHDPYGKFNPQLNSDEYGKLRFNRGMSMLNGGQTGPGKAITYDHSGIQRIRNDKHSSGTFFMISGFY